MSRRSDRRRYFAVEAGARPAITGNHNDEPQCKRNQQQSVGQYAESAHETSDIDDDLASCPEVKRAASIGSAYDGSNPPPRARRDSQDISDLFAAHEIFRVHFVDLAVSTRSGISVLSPPVMALLGARLTTRLPTLRASCST
jgi:hypothetical protein